MEPIIEAVDVARSFGGTPVVREATLAVPAGSITALVGPNGSGKTTLMLMLATLLRPDRGIVRIAGHDPSTHPRDARANLGWMPDVLGSWPTLTVQETLRAVCAMYGIRADEAAERTRELLDLADLTTLAAQRTDTLSRGQKQRLSLARALAHRPRALLLDEPAAGLDPEARRVQRRTLTRLAGEGVAILVSSHVLDELEDVATDVVFLREGRTEARSTVHAALRPGGSWRIRATDPDALASALTEMGVAATRQATLSGPAATVHVDDPAAATAILSALVTRGVQVTEFAPVTGPLEQAFTTLSEEQQ